MTLPIPNQNERIVDAQGRMSLAWRRFLAQIGQAAPSTPAPEPVALGTVIGLDPIQVTGDLSTVLRIAYTGDPHGSGIVVSDTAPEDPTDGQGWVDSTDGTFYIWYDDGTSAQWVTFGSAGGGGDAASITYDPTTSGLIATDVQAAIDELAASAGSASSDIRDSWLMG